MSTGLWQPAPPHRQISARPHTREGWVQKLTTGLRRWNRANVSIRAACVMGVPDGFCGITPPGTRTVLGPTLRRPPTFRQPTVRLSSFSHHQPAVMAITKWSIQAPSSKKSPRLSEAAAFERKAPLSGGRGLRVHHCLLGRSSGETIRGRAIWFPFQRGKPRLWRAIHESW